jgi:ubiquinone/menaquinone biosynthesis C-methylase UbiE
MAKKDTILERNYKEHSTTYDQQRFEGRANKYLECVRADAFFSLIQKDKAMRFLDVGCGTGRGTIMLGQKGYSVIGIDYTKEMLQLAQEKKKDLKLDNILFKQGNAKELPFKDNSFDCVVSFNFIHMFGIEPQKNIINEMWRVLRHGGVLIIEFDSYYKGLIMGAIVQKEKQRTHFNKPSDLKYLFEKDRLQIEKVYGAVIPYLWRFFQYLPGLCIYIEKLSRLAPFNFLAERFFVRARKK